MNDAAHCDTTVAKMLIGNKCDLDNIRDVSIEEGAKLAEAEGLFFMETSALDSTNVNKAFEIVIREIYSNVSRKVLNSDSYKAELSINRGVSPRHFITLVMRFPFKSKKTSVSKCLNIISSFHALMERDSHHAGKASLSDPSSPSHKDIQNTMDEI
ncbi:Ras-related protein RABA5d [Capsicum annuum]|nr:Ras-related protein RABA5d [Capsicum annuum]